MKSPARTSVMIGGAVATIAQIVGIARCATPHPTELDTALAMFWFALGTVVWMGVLESCALSRGRSRLWSLLAPLGPLAAVIVMRLEAGRYRLVYDTTPSTPGSWYQRIAGLVLVVAVAGGLLWAGREWVQRDQWPPRLTERAMRENEAATVARLRDLVVAQQRYRESDWDGDGKKQYASFLVHLWRSVDMNGHSIEVHLLPRVFGIAMSPAWAVDGYYFTDLRRRRLLVSSTTAEGMADPAAVKTTYAEIDPGSGWAVCATPAAYAETGFIAFIVDQTGKIWGKDQKTVQRFFPDEPRRAGWIELTDREALLHLQDSISYR